MDEYESRVQDSNWFLVKMYLSKVLSDNYNIEWFSDKAKRFESILTITYTSDNSPSIMEINEKLLEDINNTAKDTFVEDKNNSQIYFKSNLQYVVLAGNIVNNICKEQSIKLEDICIDFNGPLNN
jgi:hypothetical protein